MEITLLEWGAQAHAERERRHNNRVYFSHAPLDVHTVTGRPQDLPSAWPQVPAGTQTVAVALEPEPGQTTGEADIRAIAQARLALPHIPHIAADWTRLTPYVAQVALRFGADTLTNIPAGTPRQEIIRLITEAGLEPFECNAAFAPAQAVWESTLPVLHS